MDTYHPATRVNIVHYRLVKLIFYAVLVQRKLCIGSKYRSRFLGDISVLRYPASNRLCMGIICAVIYCPIEYEGVFWHLHIYNSDIRKTQYYDFSKLDITKLRNLFTKSDSWDVEDFLRTLCFTFSPSSFKNMFVM